MDALNAMKEQRGPEMEHGFQYFGYSYDMKETSHAIKHFSHFESPQKENKVERRRMFVQPASSRPRHFQPKISTLGQAGDADSQSSSCEEVCRIVDPAINSRQAYCEEHLQCGDAA